MICIIGGASSAIYVGGVCSEAGLAIAGLSLPFPILAVISAAPLRVCLSPALLRYPIAMSSGTNGTTAAADPLASFPQVPMADTMGAWLLGSVAATVL